MRKTLLGALATAAVAGCLTVAAPPAEAGVIRFFAGESTVSMVRAWRAALDAVESSPATCAPLRVKEEVYRLPDGVTKYVAIVTADCQD